MFYAIADNNKEIAKKVNLFIALAPVVHLNYAHEGILGSVSKNEKLIAGIFKIFNLNEIFGQNWN
jgi:hypothetical protein